MLEMTGGKPACPAIVSTCLVWRRKAPVPGNPSLQRFRTTSAAVIGLLTKPWFYNDGLPNLVPDLSLSAAGELSR